MVEVPPPSPECGVSRLAPAHLVYTAWGSSPGLSEPAARLGTSEPFLEPSVCRQGVDSGLASPQNRGADCAFSEGMEVLWETHRPVIRPSIATQVSLHPILKLLWDPYCWSCQQHGDPWGWERRRLGPGFQSSLVDGVRNPNQIIRVGAILLTLASDGRTSF